MLLRKSVLWIALTLICSLAHAEAFVIKNIHVNGLRRVSLGTVLSYLADIAVKEGESIDTAETGSIIHTLYQTNFFSNVTVKRSNDNLVIDVVEREVIGAIQISGNSKITKKQLVDALKDVGIAEGQPLDPAILNAIKQAIIQQYYNLGLYNPKLSIEVKPIEQQRVAVAIKIQEGPTARIKAIKIIGNQAFKERKLLKEFFLTTSKPWSFLTHSDQYSKEKLDADLEILRSYYMDRGYLKMQVEGTKVTITPDKKMIYIVINIKEGGIYRLGGFNVAGDLIGKQAEILKLVTLKVGDIFSRKNIINTQAKINLFLGDRGYGMADIKTDYEINENSKQVWVKFIVYPGHRVYVHQINFSGNYKTNDDVLRREMRLQEGSLFSLSKLNESRRRLANLGYLQEADYKITPVAETNNQVDIAYEIKETSAISANFQAGYSDRDGFLYGASLVDQNVFGTGKSVSVSFDNTKATQLYGLGYRDPYFTINKIGFSINGYIQKTKPNKISSELSAYTNSTYGILTSFDMPLSDYSQVSLGVGVEHIAINRAFNPNKKISDFLDEYGTIFNQLKLVNSWSYSNMDRAIFPTNGFAHSISAELYLPFNRSSLEFYKIDYNATWYRPLFKDFIFRVSTELGYGNGFGKTKKLLFLKNFFAGGIGSVRGFEANTLSSEEDQNKVVGGNILTFASASLIIPSPIKDTVRPSIFIDVGNVYDNYFKFGELRASYGIQVEWRTPLAPLVFSLAKPIPSRKKPWDHTEMFQFNLGVSI